MTEKSFQKTQALRDRAARVMPLGVSSNFRYWGPEDSPVVARAEGCLIWDADGNRYIAYRPGAVRLRDMVAVLYEWLPRHGPAGRQSRRYPECRGAEGNCALVR